MGYLTLRFLFVEHYQITRNKGSFALCRMKYENIWHYQAFVWPLVPVPIVCNIHVRSKRYILIGTF